jgi:hypothetical protein
MPVAVSPGDVAEVQKFGVASFHGGAVSATSYPGAVVVQLQAFTCRNGLVASSGLDAGAGRDVCCRR